MQNMPKYLTEFIGTFFLVLAVCLASKAGNFAPLAIGSTLMVMVYMGGHVSGAHYNPAVSLAVFLRGKLPLNDFMIYVAVQVVGAVAASYYAYQITNTTGGPKPGDLEQQFSALLVEIAYTFALALVVLNVATAKKTEGNSFYGLAIGFTVVAAAFLGGGISGGAYNPAVGLGPNIVHAAVSGNSISHVWLYVVGPLAGGALAAEAFRFQESASDGK
jgi:aquaporin Z